MATGGGLKRARGLHGVLKEDDVIKSNNVNAIYPNDLVEMSTVVIFHQDFNDFAVLKPVAA
jgi:hypothetical protein